jgi:hypothetical protein
VEAIESNIEKYFGEDSRLLGGEFHQIKKGNTTIKGFIIIYLATVNPQ